MATLRRGSKINVFVDRVPPGPPLVAAVPGTAPLKRTLFEMIFLFPKTSTDDTKRTGRGDTYQQQSHRRHQRRSTGTDRQQIVVMVVVIVVTVNRLILLVVVVDGDDDVVTVSMPCR